MSKSSSRAYVGTVVHKRLIPRRHAFRYHVFALCLDVDEIDALSARLRLFSRNRWNIMSFFDRDFGSRGQTTVASFARALLIDAGLGHAGTRIELLCYPRLLGFAFNPLSVYFCYETEGRLSALIYEVSNTFGQRHIYLIPVEGRGPIAQTCDKTFYVSPFMDMDLTYAFRIRPPGDAVSIIVDVHDSEGHVMGAAFSGIRRELTDRSLLHAWLSHPLMTLGVMAAIHWEAFKIWRKGGRLRARPPPPATSVTFVHGVRARAA